MNIGDGPDYERFLIIEVVPWCSVSCIFQGLPAPETSINYVKVSCKSNIYCEEQANVAPVFLSLNGGESERVEHERNPKRHGIHACKSVLEPTITSCLRFLMYCVEMYVYKVPIIFIQVKLSHSDNCKKFQCRIKKRYHVISIVQ